MRAAVLSAPWPEHPLEIRDVPVPVPGPGEAIVQVKAAALNHKDLFLVQRGPGETPVIPGADGAGLVHAVGEGVSGVWPGDAVVINAALSCGQCAYCRAGEQSLCDHFKILGGPDNGTLAEFVKVPAENLVPKPAHLDFAEAAALPLALATAWRALITRGSLRPGETVLIHGIGGGAALYCLQIAAAMGARVFVTSSSADKLSRAAGLGAAAGINYRSEDVAARVLELTGGVGADLVVDSGGRETLPISLAAARKGGRIVHFGVTTGPETTLNTRQLFWKQVSLIGTTMNTVSEFAAAMAFVENTRLRPTIDRVFPLAEINEAMALMNRGGQFGKIVLSI